MNNQQRPKEKIFDNSMSNKNYNETLRKKRKEKGLTIKEISERLNISQGAYYNYENLKNIPSTETMDKIANLFDTPKEDLFPLDLLLFMKKPEDDNLKYSKTESRAIEEYNLNEFNRIERKADPVGQALLREQKNNLETISKTLTEKEQKVINLYFGLDGESTHTLQELSDIFKVSKERIRQILKRALSKMRKEAKTKKIKFYDMLCEF